ncbi:MAG: glycosyltransferase family 4 protein [Desulfamplus sp.]|nr:glycosyltransferase family 4 protein [Desulfamplus sp.]
MIIMHTTCHREFGGLEKRVYNESCKMAEKGHKIVIAAPDKTPLFIKCQDRGFRCVPIEFTAKSSIKDYFVLKRLYQELKPDVLNTHGNTDSKIALLAAADITLKANLKQQIKNQITTDKKSNTKKNKNKYIIPCTILSRHISADVKPSFYNKFLYNRLCNYVFTTADYTTKHLISTLDINPDRIFTLPSGILPPSELLDRDVARANLARELIAFYSNNSNIFLSKEREAKTGCYKNISISSDSRFIGFVGRVSEDKGVGDIIEAFLMLADSSFKEPLNRESLFNGEILLNYESLFNCEVPLKYHLVIVGQSDNDFIDKMKKKVNKTVHKDNIHFIGFREDTWTYYRAFECHILASREVEGISQSLLEAMYACCPVAGSEIGGTCDIIKDGKTGLLFKQGQIEDMAKAILQILSDKSATEKRIRQAFDIVKENYTIESMVNSILSIYNRRF